MSDIENTRDGISEKQHDDDGTNANRETVDRQDADSVSEGCWRIVGRLSDERLTYEVLLDEESGEFAMSGDGQAIPVTHRAVRRWDEDGILEYCGEWQRVAVRACLAGGGEVANRAYCPVDRIEESDSVEPEIPARSLAVAAAVAAGIAVLFPFVLGWAAAPAAVVLGIVALVRNRPDKDEDTQAAAVLGIIAGGLIGLCVLATLAGHARWSGDTLVIGGIPGVTTGLACPSDSGALEINGRGIRDRCDTDGYEDMLEWKDLGPLCHSDGIDTFVRDMQRRIGTGSEAPGGGTSPKDGGETMRQVPLAKEGKDGIRQVPLADEDASDTYVLGAHAA